MAGEGEDGNFGLGATSIQLQPITVRKEHGPCIAGSSTFFQKQNSHILTWNLQISYLGYKTCRAVNLSSRAPWMRTLDEVSYSSLHCSCVSPSIPWLLKMKGGLCTFQPSPTGSDSVLEALSVGGDMEQPECPHTANGCLNWYKHLENSLAISIKTERTLSLSLWPSNAAQAKYPKEMQYMFTKRHALECALLVIVQYCNTMSASGRMAKQGIHRWSTPQQYKKLHKTKLNTHATNIYCLFATWNNWANLTHKMFFF